MDGKTILLIDDEPDMLDIYGSKLQSAGFTVLLASNGEEALRLARERIPDLILLDIKMPVMDGIAVFEHLHNDPALAHIKVVFLTAFSDPRAPEGDVHLTKDIGATDFISKGIQLDELVVKVRSYF